jgi:hypothetical protein
MLSYAAIYAFNAGNLPFAVCHMNFWELSNSYLPVEIFTWYQYKSLKQSILNIIGLSKLTELLFYVI